MEIENVARISFAARRTAQQQRNLAVGHGVLGEIVVHHQRVAARIAEVLADGRRRVGRDVEHRRGFGGRCGHDHRVAHRAGFGQRLDHRRNGGALLADGAVDADQIVLGVVDDGVQQHGRLARLAVADNQLALAAANGNHRVDGLESGGHRLAHRLAVDDAGGKALDGQALRGGDRSLVVDGLAQRVHHAANHPLADRHAENRPGALDLVALVQLGVVAQNHRAYRILFQAEGQSGDAVREAEQFAGHDLVQAMQAGDAVAQRGDGPDFVHLDLRVVVRDLLAKKLRNLVCLDLSHFCPFSDQGPGSAD